jgi:hypothetical protein
VEAWTFSETAPKLGLEFKRGTLEVKGTAPTGVLARAVKGSTAARHLRAGCLMIGAETVATAAAAESALGGAMRVADDHDHDDSGAPGSSGGGGGGGGAGAGAGAGGDAAASAGGSGAAAAAALREQALREQLQKSSNAFSVSWGAEGGGSRAALVVVLVVVSEVLVAVLLVPVLVLTLMLMTNAECVRACLSTARTSSVGNGRLPGIAYSFPRNQPAHHPN